MIGFAPTLAFASSFRHKLPILSEKDLVSPKLRRPTCYASSQNRAKSVGRPLVAGSMTLSVCVSVTRLTVPYGVARNRAVLISFKSQLDAVLQESFTGKLLKLFPVAIFQGLALVAAGCSRAVGLLGCFGVTAFQCPVRIEITMNSKLPIPYIGTSMRTPVQRPLTIG